MRFEEEETDLHVVGHHAGVHGSSAGSKGSAEFVSEGVKAKQNMSKNMLTLHSVLFVLYVFLSTEQAQSYLKICVLNLIYYLREAFKNVLAEFVR